jgi:hypothetical protein
MCVSVAAGAKTVRDRKAAQSEAALKALLTCKCIMLDHPLFLLSAVVPFHAFQLLNQLIVAAPERALHRLPTVLSPAAALQLDSLELYRDSFVAGGRTFDLPNKSIVTKATFIEELLAETREFLAKKLRAVRMAAAKELDRESKLDDGERAKLEAQRMARELEEQGLKSNSSFAVAAQQNGNASGGAAGLASASSFVSASDMDNLSVKELVSHSRRHLAAAKDRISALAIDAHRMEKWSSPAAMDNFRRSRAAEERTSSPASSPAASMLGKSAKSQKRQTPMPKK